MNDSPVRTVVEVNELVWLNDRSAGMGPCPD